MKRKRKKGRNSRLLVFVPLVFVVLLLVFFLFSRSVWDRKTRLTLAIPQSSGEITLAVFDPVTYSITSFVVPGNTQMQAAFQLGSWKAESIWALGKNEGYAGRLLVDSVAKTFKLPIDAWASQEGIGFLRGGFSAIRAIFEVKETNLTLKDRILLAIFSLRVKESNRDWVDLADFGFLGLTVLPGGEEVYVVKSSIPASILNVFTVSAISEEKASVGIVNATTNSFSALEVGKIIETLGSKVFSIQNIEPAEIDCLVYGEGKVTAQKIASLFSCDLVNQKPSGNFDVLVKIGIKFVRRF